MSWPDRTAYPFADHFLNVDGGRMHYIDEGDGPTILFVHGTPEWSFIYRHLIAGLRGRYRCVALDHIGFGLSDKPPTWGYTLDQHAANLARLIAHLDLRNFTLVAHDFGGPIGLSYAVEHPQRLSALVLFNTWMWSFAGDKNAERAGRLLAGPLGRFLYTRLNFSPRVILPLAWANKATLTPALRRAYAGAFPRPADRFGAWGFARAVLGSSAWFDALWARRDRSAHLPTLLLWGMRDPAITPRFLDRWRTLFPAAQVVELPNAGHFVQEEAPAESLKALDAFLAGVMAPARRPLGKG